MSGSGEQAHTTGSTGADAAAGSVVLVLGMHRSGTSLLASVVGALGGRLGTRLMAGDQHNPQGYFEDVRVVDCHERILSKLDRPWGTVQSSFPIRAADLRRPDLADERAELTEIIRAEVAESRQEGSPWVVKDPRLCRLLPLWHDILADLGVAATRLVSVRPPLAAAKSLAARDGLPEDLGQALWLVHYADLLHWTAGEVAAVVEYDAWFADAQAQARRVASALPWPPGEAAMRAAAAQCDARLRHHDAAAPGPCGTDGAEPAGEAASGMVLALHEGLQGWAQTGRPPSDLLARAVDVRRVLSDLSAWQAAALEQDYVEGRTGQLIADLRADVRRLDAWYHEYRRAHDAKVQELEELAERYERVKGDVERLDAWYHEYRRAYDASTQQLMDLAARYDDLKRQKAEQDRLLHRLRFVVKLARLAARLRFWRSG